MHALRTPLNASLVAAALPPSTRAALVDDSSGALPSWAGGSAALLSAVAALGDGATAVLADEAGRIGAATLAFELRNA